jgi:signal transduction histidine kinase
LASHEFRTPLTSLELSAHALARKAAEVAPAALGTLSERVLRQIGRLERLADRLLDAHEIGRPGPSIARTMTNLTDVVREVANAFTETARSRGSKLVLSGDARLVTSCDPIRIEQVLTNLIDNALKFGEGRPVEIDAHKSGPSAVITVKDSGVGIPELEQKEVFARYGRASSARGVGGLGLGLYLVCEIVKEHGGEVRLHSEPNQGTTVTVELPLQNGESSRIPLG